MDLHIFSEVTLLIAIAAIISILMRVLRQPLVIGYIITGILVGPAALGLVQSPDTLGLLGEFGIALLLFIVGLGLNPSALKEVGKIAVLTGVGQVVFTSSIGFLIAIGLGYSAVAAFYIAVALTFSSTIIILKLLSDKKEQHKLHGKISIGFLLVQDIVAAIALVLAAAGGGNGFDTSQILQLLAKGAGLFVVIFIGSVLIGKMTKFLSKSQEMLFLFTLAWGFGIAALSMEINFSLEVGALFAGVALASKSYAQEVSSRLRPLRDFFIIVFFISLGSGITIQAIGPLIWQAAGLSAFVLIGNPIIVMIIMGLLGYTRRTGFKAGLTVAQISEFSLIFILLGASTGQISEEIVALVTAIGIVTIAISTYMITYSDQLYQKLEKYLRVFERKRPRSEGSDEKAYGAVLFGYHRGGNEFVKMFENLGKKYVVIDYDPESIERLEKHGTNYLYGDATDVELLEEAGISGAELIVSMITDHHTNKGLLKILERINPDAITILHAATIEQSKKLYELGATYVMLPHYIGTAHISALLEQSGLDKEKLANYREAHRLHLDHHYE